MLLSLFFARHSREGGNPWTLAFARHSGESGNPASLLLVVVFKDQKRFVRYAAEFISFDKRQKKRTKEKRFSRRSNPRVSLLSGFFDSPSMARSKNGAHPVRRPPGLHKLLASRL